MPDNTQVTNTEIQKLAKTSNRASNAGCLILLCTAGFFTYFAIRKTIHPDAIIGICILGVAISYGFANFAMETNNKVKQLKKQAKQK